MKPPIQGSKFFNLSTLSNDSDTIVTTLMKALIDYGQVGSCYDKNGKLLNEDPKQNKSTSKAWLCFFFNDFLLFWGYFILSTENGSVIPPNHKISYLYKLWPVR